MMRTPLLVRSIAERAGQVFAEREVVSVTGQGIERSSYGDVTRRARRLASALQELGIRPGDRVATFGWNSRRHLELYLAVPSMGAVLHTLNVRLFEDDLRYIVEHAGDRVIFLDASLAQAMPRFDGVEHEVLMRDADAAREGAIDYEEFLASGDERFEFPEIDENAAAAMCYTSGTTGRPKGVVYSHRSIVLHTLLTNQADGPGLRERDVALPIVPMFHANAWGMPYSAFLSGATLHMPGPFLQPQHLTAFMAAERSTVTSGVPTIWNAILDYGQDHEIDLSSLRLGNSGGSAAPRVMLERFQDQYGLRIIQGWGMTEMSPVGGMAIPPAEVPEGTTEDLDWRMRSGRVIHGVEMRVVGKNGEELPWDGASEGEIEVRGPWVTGSYHNDPAPEKFRDGWLRTGDVGTIDDRGFFTITDRIKDVIKSGGEWISSVDLENQLMAHPAVQEAAVIGMPDSRWGERPLASVVLRPGMTAKPAELADFGVGSCGVDVDDPAPGGDVVAPDLRHGQ